MEIFPAIDLYEGKAVRLVHGDYQQMTVYSEHPEKIAEHFCSCGAKYAHLVDLEGARDGTTPNLQLVEKIASESDLRLEIGGGIRTEEVAKRYLDAGCWRVILGTAAVENPDLLEKLAARFGKRIAVGIDVRGERVAVRGWMSETDVTLDAMCKYLVELGIEGAIITDIGRDGAMRGSNQQLYAALIRKHPELSLTASGGVSSYADLTALKAAGVFGAIIGKAYYTGALDLRRVIEEYT